MIVQNSKRAWGPFLGTGDHYLLHVYVKSMLIQFIFINIQWNVIAGSNSLICHEAYLCAGG